MSKCVVSSLSLESSGRVMCDPIGLMPPVICQVKVDWRSCSSDIEEPQTDFLGRNGTIVMIPVRLQCYTCSSAASRAG